MPLGDCWRHPAIVTDDATNGLVPLHKLSQWLAYSLIEPLQGAGIEVTDIDGLTGLAEYRNGGLFIDTGVLVLRDPAEARRAAQPSIRPGGRVARADRGAARSPGRPGAAARSGVTPKTAARARPGRRHLGGRPHAGAATRPDGGPPITVVSDGTVF